MQGQPIFSALICYVCRNKEASLVPQQEGCFVGPGYDIKGFGFAIMCWREVNLAVYLDHMVPYKYPIMA